MGRRWTRRERAALIAVAAATAISHLGLLGTVPGGLYLDEASIGYDAWAVAHTGHDQNGALLPLFFQSFGDWKSPLYHYLLAPLTWVLPLTAGVIRLPAALCGIAVCLLVAALTRRRGGSPTAVVLSLAGAATTPWLVVEGRLGFEVITLVLALVAAAWCLVHAAEGDGPAWSIGAGACLGLAVFAYPSGRLGAGLFTAALVATHLRLRGAAPRRWWLALAGPLAAYALLGAWALRHPGALTARLDQVSIGYDHPSAGVYIARFADSWLRHVDPRFLLVSGDADRRHATGLFGMFLLAIVPAVAAGVVGWWRRRRSDPLAAFLLLALVLAPVPAGLTGEGIPHALRASPLLAVLLVAAAEGWPAIVAALRGRGRLAVIAGGLAAVQIGGWWLDAGLRWPDRSAFAFDAGVEAGIARAHDLAGGHRLLLDDRLGEPAAHALLVLRPDPGTSRAATLASIRVLQLPAADIASTGVPGDIAVLRPDSPPPSGAALVDIERGPAPDGGSREEVRVYRLGG